MKIYHYTTIDSLAMIMSSRSIKFNRLDKVDDCTGGRVTMLFDTASQNKIQGNKAMRKFLSSTAGASFNQEQPTRTVGVRKYCVGKKHHPSSISHLPTASPTEP